MRVKDAAYRSWQRSYGHVMAVCSTTAVDECVVVSGDLGDTQSLVVVHSLNEPSRE